MLTAVISLRTPLPKLGVGSRQLVEVAEEVIQLTDTITIQWYSLMLAFDTTSDEFTLVNFVGGMRLGRKS